MIVQGAWHKLLKPGLAKMLAQTLADAPVIAGMSANLTEKTPGGLIVSAQAAQDLQAKQAPPPKKPVFQVDELALTMRELEHQRNTELQALRHIVAGFLLASEGNSVRIRPDDIEKMEKLKLHLETVYYPWDQSYEVRLR